jgi:hypothetical protein
LEDPIKEISALQLVGNYHPNVVGTLDILQDDEYLDTVMPMCSGGDLFDRVMRTDRKKAPSPRPASGRSTPDNVPHGIDEDQARLWFKQLLAVSSRLLATCSLDVFAVIWGECVCTPWCLVETRFWFPHARTVHSHKSCRLRAECMCSCISGAGWRLTLNFLGMCNCPSSFSFVSQNSHFCLIPSCKSGSLSSSEEGCLPSRRFFG